MSPISEGEMSVIYKPDSGTGVLLYQMLQANEQVAA